MTAPLLLLLFLVSAYAGTLDTVSMMQGLVKAHQQMNFTDRTCTLAQFESAERLDIHIAAKSQLVVIRGSGEDLRWMDLLPEIPAVIYNRNGFDELLPKPRQNLNVVLEENEGGQEGCMLNHITRNYDDLAEFTIFMRGWPFWSCGGAVQEVRRALANMADPRDRMIVGNGGQHGLIPLAATFHEYSLAGGKLGRWHDLATVNTTKKTRDNAIKEAAETFKDACTQVLGEPCPEKLWVAEGAQWAVSAARIRSHPKDFYERLQGMKYAGSDERMQQLRGLVMEAVWPAVWGSSQWQPKWATAKSVEGKDASTRSKADSYGDFCIYTSEPKATGTARSRRSMCEMEQHEDSVAVIAGQSWKPEARLRALPNLKITADMVSPREGQDEPVKPGHFQPACFKRHLWPIIPTSRARNKQTGQCIQFSVTTQEFAVSDCTDLEAQKLKLVSHENAGSYQIQDYAETACLYHSSSSGGGAPCKRKPFGPAIDKQRWELHSQGADAYQIRAAGASGCLVQSDQSIMVGQCSGEQNTLWELPDLKHSPSRVDGHEQFITRDTKGALTAKCVTRFHSEDPQANLDIVQPDWKKRGQIWSSFTLVDGPNNSYYLMDPQTELYLGCDRKTRDGKTRDAVFNDAKTPWKFQRLGGSLVFLQGSRQTVLEIDNSVLKCVFLPESGVPMGSAAFIVEF